MKNAAKSPLGELKLIASNNGLRAILWENEDPGRVRIGTPVEDSGHPVLQRVQRQLQEYFAAIAPPSTSTSISSEPSSRRGSGTPC
ncbi:MAG TPA: hypothetical protein VIC29_00995 [Steroidobacteraceae bacterium]